MLSHSDFPVRMVQWGEERSFCTDHKSRLHDHLIQLELLYFRQPFLTHSSPQERDLYLGRIKFLHTWSRSFRGKPNWVRQLKKLNKRGLSWNKAYCLLLSQPHLLGVQLPFRWGSPALPSSEVLRFLHLFWALILLVWSCHSPRRS